MATEATPRLTRPTRLKSDLVEKLDDLLEYLDLNSAEYLDPIARPKIEADHAANRAGIVAMRAARERAAKLRDEAPELHNDFEPEG